MNAIDEVVHMWSEGCVTGWGWLMALWILFWLLIVGGIVWLVVGLARSSRVIQPIETPLDILNKRYAGGEINKDEYERIKQDILQGDS